MGLNRELVATGVDEVVAAKIVDDLKTDFTAAELNGVDRTMLEYSVKLNNLPGKMNAKDVEALRSVGFDDVAIHDICAIVGYFAFVNRIADGLGVELEERFS